MCKKLSDIINTAFKVLDNHVEEHMYFNKLDKQQASQDFLNKFYFAIRETYCELCKDSPSCEEYKDYKQYKGWSSNFGGSNILGGKNQ